uniref:Uncharacterized protein n=1 Tax=Anguilla anguilla TaxID=7936 RepID=A0A0E9XI96_ANGAN
MLRGNVLFCYKIPGVVFSKWQSITNLIPVMCSILFQCHCIVFWFKKVQYPISFS